MAIIPVGHRVLIKQERFDEHDEVMNSAKRAGLEIITDRNVRYQASVDKGEVVAVGPTAWKDFGEEPWARVGDSVVFTKNAGKIVQDPSEKDVPETARTPYVLLNDEDIIAVLKD